jgi:hypothetical protein
MNKSQREHSRKSALSSQKSELDDAPKFTQDMLDRAEIREGSNVLRPAKNQGPLPKTGKDF